MRQSLSTVLAPLLFCACAASQPVPQSSPGAAVEKLSVEIEERDQNLSGLQALTRVSLKNTGDFAATASHARYEVVMDGQVVGQGELPLSVAIAPGAEAVVALPIPFLYAPDEPRVMALDARKAPIDYAVRGRLEVGGAQIEFARASAVRAPRLPKLALQSLEAIRPEGQGLRIDASLGIENPNPFPVTVKELRWKLSLAGKPAGAGSLARDTRLEPASQTTFELSLPLEPSDLKAREIPVTAASLAYAMEGELELQGMTVQLDDTGDARLLHDGD